MLKSLLLLVVALLSACSVRQEDLDAWAGQPAALLDVHPLFLTMPVVKTTTPDGIEIRNYVNGANVGRCLGSSFGTATAYGGQQYATAYSNYAGVSSCISQFSACNNIFYIQGDRVIEYAPTASGMARCMTDERVRPRRIGSRITGPGSAAPAPLPTKPAPMEPSPRLPNLSVAPASEAPAD